MTRIPSDLIDQKAAIAALLALAKHNIPADVQELLVNGNPERNIAAGAFSAAMRAALVVYNLERD